MKKLTDIEIIESVIKGNVNDFTLLIDRYKHKAFSLLVNILKNKMDAEEALQDSFIKAYNSLNTFRGDSQFSTWFYKIVFNTGMTIVSAQKEKIELGMNSVDEMFDLKDEDNEVYSVSENKKMYLLKIVDKLPIKNSLVVILFYIDNLSLKEISEVMDLSLVNTKVLLHRSRNLLKDLLIQHNYQEEIL